MSAVPKIQSCPACGADVVKPDRGAGTGPLIKARYVHLVREAGEKDATVLACRGCGTKLEVDHLRHEHWSRSCHA